MQAVNHQQVAQQEASRLAIAQLAAVTDWTAHCARLGLPAPVLMGGGIRINVLGLPLELRPPTFAAQRLDSEKPVAVADRLLALHYLRGEVPLDPTGQWLTFRDFPGGQFYWEPFRSRSIKPLIGRMGNDLDLLRARLRRFSARVTPLSDGGLQAVIQALGVIEMMLVYRVGDDEFPPSGDLLYDACARRILCAEDAAALGSRFCFGLLAA